MNRLLVLAFCTPVALSATSAFSREFTWTYELTGGTAAQRFDGSFFDLDWFFTPVAQNLDLQGVVRIDSLAIESKGTMNSANGGYFDLDVFFLGSRTPNALPGQRFLRVRIDDLPAHPTRWSYVIRSDSGGPQSFDAAWDFDTETGTAQPFLHDTKFSRSPTFETFGGGVTGGLRSQVRAWSAAWPTSATIDGFKITARGTIVRYQILPTPNTQAFEIEPGDDAFNALQYFSESTLKVNDRLTNQSTASIINNGSLQILESQERTELVNQGGVVNGQSGTVANRGRFVNQTGATLVNLGRFDNFASLAGDPSPAGPGFPSSRDPGLFNEGTVQILAGTFVNNDQASLSNRGRFEALSDGRFENHGSFENGSEQGGGGTFRVAGPGSVARHEQGSFLNYATMEVESRFISFGMLDNRNTLRVGLQSGDEASFDNHGTLRNQPNFALGILDRPAATVQVNGRLNNFGELDNRASLEISGELHNTGEVRNFREFRGHPEVKVNVTGRVVNSGTFSSSGNMRIDGGTFQNDSVLSTDGDMIVLGGGSVTGGVVNNGGTLRVIEDGALTGLTLYRQTVAEAVTIVNGTLQAAEVRLDAGTLMGASRVEAGQILVGPDATLAPGNSPGTLVLAGDVTINGLLDLEIGAGALDQLVVEGALQFGPGARVRYSFIEGFLPQAGQRWALHDFVSAWAPITGLDDVLFETAGLPTGSEVAWQAGELTVTYVPAPIPEPATWATLAAGLGLLGLARCTSPRRTGAATRG